MATFRPLKDLIDTVVDCLVVSVRGCKLGAFLLTYREHGKMILQLPSVVGENKFSLSSILPEEL
jgi:hypothetical protein